MTKPDLTIGALKAVLPKLSKQGVVTLVAYPGTAQGLAEKEALEEFLVSLSQKEYNCCHWTPLNQINQPPLIYMIQKR